MTWKAWALDTAERAGFTAAQAFLAAWVITDQSTVRNAALAAVAAGIAVVKAAVASRRAATVSPAAMF